MGEIDRLGDEISIELPVDDGGWLGRECPDSNCEGYFKITPGTGLEGSEECYCTYCGHKDDRTDFATQDQIEYAISMAKRRIVEAFTKDLKKAVEFNSRPQRGGIGLSFKVKPGARSPIHYYIEEDLETIVECDSCALRYMVYGVFAYCPDCGRYNSLQIFEKGLEVIEKLLALASTQEEALKEQLVEDALENCVSAFDGFGRNLCRAHSTRGRSPEQVSRISFQSIVGAQRNILEQFAIDISGYIQDTDWLFVIQCFQKRHVFAHNAGVIDKVYLEKSGDADAVIGRKLRVTEGEIRQLVPLLKQIATDLSASLGTTA